MFLFIFGFSRWRYICFCFASFIIMVRAQRYISLKSPMLTNFFLLIFVQFRMCFGLVSQQQIGAILYGAYAHSICLLVLI